MALVCLFFAATTVAGNTTSLPTLTVRGEPEPQWGIHLFGGVSAGHTKIAQLVSAPWNGEYGDNYLVATALSHRLVRNGHCVFDGEVGVGYRFPLDSPEGWAAIYVRYELPWDKFLFVSVAIDTGLSYIAKVPDVEKEKSTSRGNVDGTRLLHYLGPEITFALPRDRNKEGVLRIHHRSGAMGTFGGVWGGSNVVTLGFRYRF